MKPLKLAEEVRMRAIRPISGPSSGDRGFQRSARARMRADRAAAPPYPRLPRLGGGEDDDDLEIFLDVVEAVRDVRSHEHDVARAHRPLLAAPADPGAARHDDVDLVLVARC